MATAVSVPTFAPLRVPEYRRVWVAAVVSNLGTFLQLVAAPWLMLELTRSPFLVSLVTASLALPRLLLTLPAGALADAYDRRTLLITGQVASAATTLLMAVTTWRGLMTPELLVVLSFGLGIGTAVAMPAYQTLIPDLVPRPMVPAAVTLNSAGFNVARAVGPAVGGAMVAAGQVPLAFALNAASYLVIAATLLTLPRESLSNEGREPVWHAVVTGIRYVRYTRPVAVVLAVGGFFGLTAASVQTLLPNVVADDLGLGAGAYGVLLGLFGGGALAGAMTREKARTRLRGEVMLPMSILGFGIAGTAFGLSRIPVLSGVALAVSGLFWVWTLTTLNATVQLLAPRWARSRVMSLYLLAVVGIQPIGSLVAGGLGEGLGAATAVAVLTVATALLGVVSTRLELPILGEIEEPAPPDDWSIPRHASRVGGSPVLVVTTWTIAPEDVDRFLEAMRELRRHRYRVGARRWSLYRDADDPLRMTEVFQVHDWEEHLRQHARIDEEAAAALRYARSFDRDDGPRTRHLAGIDLLSSAEPIAEQLLTVHEEMHSHDGSVPLARGDGPTDRS